MASEPGGRADKLGNEFERLCAVRHLIELIAGTATTFQIEALGDDEKGTEFWVGRPATIREARQCKRENGSVGKWSMADLASKGILSTAKFQLDRDPSHRFVFVSGDKATHLSDLCERAERCDSPFEFVTYLTTTSRELTREFDALCHHLGIDSELSDGAAKVVDFLRRFRPEVVDKNRLRLEVEELSERWISGEPGDVVAALKDLLDRSIGKTLSEADVIAGLPAGARPRDLAKDPTLRSSLEELGERFDRSYRHLLIGGRSLGRREAADLAATLIADDGPRLILLHGLGGDGKSGVVFEVVERLRLHGVACLPLRLDRDRPEDSPLKFGRVIGLPGSPANCLAAVAGDGPGVLVLDQVDAIRWTAAHSSHAWDTCERMVSEALRRPNLRVVVVCRSFDLEGDPRIMAWEKESKASRVKVGPLEDETIDAVIASLGISPASLDARQRAILRSPQGLYLWLALHEGNAAPPAFRTMTDLMRRYWESIRRKLSGIREGGYEAVLDALVTHMDRRGGLCAPRTVVAQWPNEVAALRSLNVLTEDSAGRLLFSHQSPLDYLTAVRLLQQVHMGKGTVLGWLTENDQSLFRRGQLRQILTLLRDDDPEGFLDSMKDLLLANDVRFHLQQLAMQMLAYSESPSNEEVELVLDLLDRPEWADHVFFQVLAGREAWFDALHQRKTLRKWLEGTDEIRVNLVINIVERVVATRGAEVEPLFLDQGQERWPGRLIRAVWRTSPEKLTNGLFDAVVGLKRRGEWDAFDFVDWKALAQSSPSRCLRLLDAKIGRELDEFETKHDGEKPRRRDRDESSMLVELSSLTQSAEALPTEAWDKFLPYFSRISRLLSRRRSGTRQAGLDQHSARRIRRVLRRVLTAAGRAMARKMPQSFWDRVAEKHGAGSVRRLINRCTSHGPDDRADFTIDRLLRDPSQFRSGRGDRGLVYLTAWKILRRYSGGCSDELFAKLQEAVLLHRPAEERDYYCRYHDRARREKFWGEMKFDVLGCNELGLGQYLLLSGMSKSRLSPDAMDRLGVLRRKFGPIKPLFAGRPKPGGGWVGSPIPADRLSKVSDRNWLGIVRRDWSSRSHRSIQMGPDRLGEASVETFSRDLGRMTSLQPARFARLALRIPVNHDPKYPIAILQSLAENKPPTESANGPSGEPATVVQVEAVIRRFWFLEGNREFAMSVCSAIRQRHDAAWADDTMLLLARLAVDHPDPEPERYAVSRRTGSGQDDDEDLSHVPLSSINCVRGAAAGAIEAVLFGDPGRLGMFQAAIDSLLGDPHPAVRAASVGLALPIYNIEREDAVDAFLRACSHPDDAVLLAYDLSHFLRYSILDFADRLRPLIDRMVASKIGRVAKTGAAWAALAWAHRGLMDDVVSLCVEGTRWQRIGVAETVSNAIARGPDRSAVFDCLRSLFDDPEKEVRDVAAGFFRIEGFHDLTSAVSLAETFLQSRAFDDNVNYFLHALGKLTSPLKPYSSVICGVADRFVGPLADEARDYRTHRPLDASQLAKVLLRLYEQSEHDRPLRRKCLHAWDDLLRNGLGYDVLGEVDG